MSGDKQKMPVKKKRVRVTKAKLQELLNDSRKMVKYLKGVDKVLSTEKAEWKIERAALYKQIEANYRYDLSTTNARIKHFDKVAELEEHVATQELLIGKMTTVIMSSWSVSMPEGPNPFRNPAPANTDSRPQSSIGNMVDVDKKVAESKGKWWFSKRFLSYGAYPDDLRKDDDYQDTSEDVYLED